MKSQIFSDAWALVRSGIYSTISDALRAAWLRYRLICDLRTDVVRFRFLKADGTLRDAVGTLDSNRFNYRFEFQPVQRKAHIVRYWDLEKMAWRSCRVDRIVSLQKHAA